MSRVIDAVIAYRVLKLLVTPFNKTKAFQLGIIDDKGKVLIKSRNIENAEQRNAYTLLQMPCYLESGDGEVVLPVGVVDRRQVD